MQGLTTMCRTRGMKRIIQFFPILAACGLLAGCPAAPPSTEAQSAATEDAQSAHELSEVREAIDSVNSRLDSIEARLAALEREALAAPGAKPMSEYVDGAELSPQEDSLARQVQPLRAILQGDAALPETQDDPQGDAALSDEPGPMPIAGWNWVPWQEVTAGMRLGVVAFHIDGIDRVEFHFAQAPGATGQECAVVVMNEPSLNEASGTVEYHAAVPEGVVEVSATVYGKRGPPRELGVRPFNPPRDDVLIIHGQRIEGPIDPAGKKHLWLQNCELVGGGHWIATTFQSIYAIDCRASGVDRFFQKVELVRNCTVDGFSSDAFRDCRMVINCTAANQTRVNDVHPDVVQFYQAAENAIVYGLTAVENIGDQGIFSRGKGVEHKGVAIVNCKLNLSGFPAQNQWGTRTHHFIVESNEFLGAPFTINMDDTVATGFRGSTFVAFRNNTFQWVKILPDDASVRAAFRGNRFINRWPAYVSDRAGKEVGDLIGAEATLIQSPH